MRLRLKRIARLLLFIVFLLLVYTFLKPDVNIDRDVHLALKSNVTLIDWEDYKFAHKEQERDGPGERGLPVKLTSRELEIASGFQNFNGFNTYVSEMIKVDRSVRDLRHSQCIGLLYSRILPTVSVVIPFFEEHFETLVRTYVSVLNRSPKHLIKDIILVDDGSHRTYLKQKLDDHLNEKFPDKKVRVVRLPKRQGLIAARIEGAKYATGEVLIFLDSHCETSTNWLPPLLDPISKDYRTVVCPFIDVIDADTFEYRSQDEGARGAFDWEFYYKRLPRLKSDAFHPEKPFDSPVMAGGLFAISKKWFWELGGYDPGIVIWGGEQYELSFKIWMCGGRMIDTPCSRVGHIYRTHPTDFPNAGIGDFVGKNYKRVAEVWMDEYKEYLYNRRPHYRNLDPGDLTKQKVLRRKLKCKSFKWFMTHVAFDLTKKYPVIEPIAGAYGELRSVADSSFCIDADGATSAAPIKLAKCISDNPILNGLQDFKFTYLFDIRIDKQLSCWDVPKSSPQSGVFIYTCHGGGGNQRWYVQSANKDDNNPVRLVHMSGKCLESNTGQKTVYINHCDSSSSSQLWNWRVLQMAQAAQDAKHKGL